MNPKDFEILLTVAHAFLKDSKLQEYEGFQREDFISWLNDLFQNDSFAYSVTLLEQVVNEELQAPSLPSDLENKIIASKRAQDQEKEIRIQKNKLVAERIAQMRQQQKPYLDLAQAAKQKPPEKVVKSEEKQWQEVNEELAVKIQKQLLAFDPSLVNDPDLLNSLTEEIKTELVSLSLTSEEADFEKSLILLVNEALTKNGYLINTQKKEAFVKELHETTGKEIQKIKATIETPIPPEVLSKYSQNTENVAFAPAYVLTNPSLVVAYAQKAFVSLPVKFLQQGAEEASPAWQKMLKEGVFVENYDLTIQKLREAGLSEDHPAITKLQRERNELHDAQKTPEGKDKSVVGLLKTFFKPSELLGKQKGVSDSTGVALSGKTLWHSGKGWAFNLKNAFNQFGLASKIYQRFPSLPGKTLVTSRLSIGTLAWSNRRLWRPVYLAVAKTAAGKALKTGIRKASIWLGTELGVQAGILAAGTATGVGAPVALLINLGIEAFGFVWNKGIKPIFQKISQWIKEPDKAFATLMVGAGIVIFVPTFAVGGALLMGLGALGLLGSAGSILGGLATGATSLFSALISAPFAGVPITAFLLTVLGSVGALTFFIVMTTSSAFILPKGMGGGVGGPPLALVPPECQSPRHLSENVLCQLNSCGIQAVTSYNFSQVQVCMGNFPDKDVILNQFQASLAVDQCNCLQCVGFVRGIMSALGKDPGGGKDAKNYLDDPVPSGYIRSMNMLDITVGDLAIMRSGLYGHITIVVKRDGNKITVAQAWGGTGAVNMTDFNISQFDGYLRP